METHLEQSVFDAQDAEAGISVVEFIIPDDIAVVN
jgi:hypothetical protein